MDPTVDDILSAAYEVHAELGAGHSEATYHAALERELSERGVSFGSEGTITIFYKDTPVGRMRPDLFVDGMDGTIVVELKSGAGGGEDQLDGYLKTLDGNDNYDISDGLLIQFSDTVEEYIP